MSAPESSTERSDSFGSVPQSDNAKSDVGLLCEQLILGESHVDVPRVQVPAVLEHLRERKQAILNLPEDSEFDYDALDRIDEVLGELVNSSKQLLYSEGRTLPEPGPHCPISAAADRDEEQFSNMKRFFDDKRSADINRLVQEQQRELDDLQRLYSGEPPPKYRKVSIEVMNMRSQEKTLRLAGHYREAKQMRLDADAKEVVEMQRNRARWRRAKGGAEHALAEKHQRQLNCLKEKWDRQWQAFEPESKDQQRHWKRVIETNERRMTDVIGGKTEFLKTRREQLPQLTARPNSQFSSARSARSRAAGQP
jgi:hypothetical protein